MFVRACVFVRACMRASTRACVCLSVVMCSSSSMHAHMLYVCVHAFVCKFEHAYTAVWEKTYLNNMLGTPIILIIAFFREDIKSLASRLGGLSWMDTTVILASCVMGLGISMSGTSCRSTLSATSVRLCLARTGMFRCRLHLCCSHV
jgi:hypothetical protein